MSENFTKGNEMDAKTIKLACNFEITIDGRKVRVIDDTKNIVGIAKTAGIGIPAPCYTSQKRKACCMACVIEIDKKHRYACCTRPKEGMNIIVNREDLKALRKERLLKYMETIRNSHSLK